MAKQIANKMKNRLSTILVVQVLLLLSPQTFANSDSDEAAGEDVSYYLDQVLNQPAALQWRQERCQSNPPAPPAQQTPMSDEQRALLNRAQVVIIVNKAPSCSAPDAQTMKIYVRGELAHEFVISTASESMKDPKIGAPYRASTPTGYFRPGRIFRDYYSFSWGGARMQNAVFFAPGGVGLHSTVSEHFHELGSRASGGCVRMWPEDSEIMNDIVRSSGNPNWSADAPGALQRQSVPQYPKLKNVLVNGIQQSVPEVSKTNGEFMSGKKGNTHRMVNSVDTIIHIKNERDPAYWTAQSRFTEQGEECLRRLKEWQKGIRQKVKSGESITEQDRSIPWR